MRLLLINGLISLCMYVSMVAAEVQEFTLDNGLKILVREDQRSPVVISQVWYKVGASYEHEGITGVSHALEHMMFQGTQNYAPGEFSRIIAENGGNENAFTGADYTAYFQTLENSRLSVSLELEADRMRNLVLLDEEFNREIEVIKEERRWRTEDKPRSYTHEVAMATAFQTGPYRHPIIGWMNDINSLSITDLSKWYKQWYAPNNATLVVAGDVKAGEVYRLAQQYFGSLAAGVPVKAAQRPEVEQQGIKRVVVQRPAELPYLLMGYKVPVLRTAKEQDSLVWEPYALEVLAWIVDGGASSRFASRLVRGKEIAASVTVSYNLLARLNHLFTVSGTPAGNHTAAQLEAAVRDEIKALQTQPVSQEELARVKTQAVAHNVYERDSLFYQAMIVGIAETVGLSWMDVEKYVDSVQAVTAEQVQAVAKKYLRDDRLTVATLKPQPLAKNTTGDNKRSSHQ